MRQEEKEAIKLLEKHNITEAPVRVEDIALGEGVQIARHRFGGHESGFILRDEGMVIIGVNTQTSRRRQRFTIAHELGHLLLHQGKPLIVDHSVRVNFRDDISSMATDSEEIEANAFAAALLMPPALLFKHLKAYATKIAQNDVALSREDLVSQLAREFDVSGEAMGYRLINIGLLGA